MFERIMEVAVDEKIRLQIEKIEDNQAELRASIEQTKKLSAQADKLMKRHKKTLKDQTKD